MTEPFPQLMQPETETTGPKPNPSRHQVSIPTVYQSLTDYQLLQTIAVDSERTALATEKLLSLIESSLARSPKRPLPRPETPDSEPGEPTTPQPPASPTEFHNVPEQLLSVQGDMKEEVLANGLKAPRYLIEALNDLDRLWPGASIYEARPAIVAHIISAQNAMAKTLYPFCMNDDPNVPAKSSPCIKRKGHNGRHQDNDDGSWP